MSNILNWFRTYNTEISWFIIGMMINNALYHLSFGQLDMALVDLALAGINFYFWKTRP